MQQCLNSQPAADHARGARPDLRVRRGALLEPARRGPPGARLPRVPRRAHPRHRRPPRRHAADVQGVRRGAVPARPVPGRVRHRDAGARHQHAGPLGGHREAVQVERRDPRRHHAGGVHPADRPGRSSRHRRGGPRRRALAAGARPQGGGRSRVDPHLSAQVELPSVVQHGRQPGAPVRPRARPRAAGVVLRPVPGRQGRRRAGAAAAQERGRAGGVRRRGRLRQGRLHGVRRPAAPALRHREEPRQVAPGRPSPGGHRLAGVAAPRRRDRGAQRSVRRHGGRDRPRHPRRPGGTASLRAHRRPACAPAEPGRLPDPGRLDHAGEDPAQLQRPQPAVAPRPRLDAAQPHSQPDPAAAGKRPGGRHADPDSEEDAPDRGAAQAAARAPVPRLSRPRGPRSLGRALLQARPRRQDAQAPDRAAHQHDRPAVRPGLRRTHRARLPRG